MAEETAFENSQISNSEGLVTLTLDRVILHTAVHRSSTFNYTRIVIEIKETFRGRRDKHLRQALLGRFCRRVDLKCTAYTQLCVIVIIQVNLC